ncbi:hypothetical protein [Avrilella dinanensis]|uniref:Addiction module protein n=1 Tax=Avrilella dinanensis TaxID=2008672 RepID=A0A2M9R3U8_9FLAO|nr:hypothetical protein [Avrilella dinanensis]PJR03537.1 hypothetical protein CDL10_02660 [Avrilella dinanensis]
MNTSELKLDIIQKITELKEVRVIEEIKKLLDFELNDIYELSESQKNRVAEAREEYTNGNFLNEEEADKEIDQWLNEK